MSNTEDIKFIEEMIKEYKTFGDLHNPDFEDTDRIYKALENMLKRIKELEQKNKHLKYLYDDCCKCLLDTIEKQKVKDKIEELDSIQKEMTTKNHNADNINDCYRYGDEAQKAMYKKEALEEILEDK